MSEVKRWRVRDLNDSLAQEVVRASDYDAISQQLDVLYKEVKELSETCLRLTGETWNAHLRGWKAMQEQAIKLSSDKAEEMENRTLCGCSTYMEELTNDLQTLPYSRISEELISIAKPCTCSRLQFPHRRTSECLTHAP